MDTETSPEQIKTALDRIRNSEGFRSTELRFRFLEYIVTETLEGRADAIKGYPIGVDVYGRSADFDPQVDPLVRLEASRLRRELEYYYLTDGSDDEIRINIPKGRYVPSFEIQQPKRDEQSEAERPEDVVSAPRVSETVGDGGAEPRPRDAVSPTLRSFLKSRLIVSAIAGAVLLLLIGGTIGFYRQVDTLENSPLPTASILGPTVYVVPFSAVSVNTSDSSLAGGLTVEVNNVLSQFVELQVYPVKGDFKAPRPEINQPASGEPRLRYILSGSVQRLGDSLRVTANLRDARDGLQVWSERYNKAYLPVKIFEIQESIATNVARKLAEPFGLLRQFARLQIAATENPTLNAYECVLLGYKYRQTFTVAMHAEARSCLEQASRTDPNYARIWALLAYIYIDEIRFFYNVRPNALDRAVNAATRAVELAPKDVLSQQALSVALFSNGDIDRALAAARMAVALNPHNHEALLQLGYRMAAAGDWKAGISLARKAIVQSPAAPNWYFWVPALYDYKLGKYEDARIGAEKAGLQGLVLFEATRAMIYGQLGLKEKAAASLKHCRKLDPKFDARARQWFAAHQFSDDTLNHFMEGLFKAGLHRQG